MVFEMFQDVILTVDLPEKGLCPGDIGTVVDHHAVPGGEDGYSIEFFDMTGDTVAVVTLPQSNLRTPSAADRPAVRALTTTTRRR